jgi:RNA polymerase sigma factor (sigma-70 family)
MPRTGNRSTDDFSDRSSEELIVLVQQDRSEPARQELLARSYRLACALIVCLARRAGLPAADADDAQQEVACRLPQLLRSYHPGRHGPFRRLLAVATRRWFRNYLRGRRRDRCRLFEGDRDESAHAVCRFYPPPPRFGDPLALLLWKERLARLEEAVRTLDELGQRLCAGVRAGRLLTEMAPELGLSVDAAKRSWKKVKANLRGRVAALVAEEC